jgi:hypothetical protein
VDAPRAEEPRQAEPPAFLVREEPRREVPSEVAPEAPRAPATEPRVEAKKILEDAGLMMIETDRAKAPAPAAAPEQEPSQLGRPRRERPRTGTQDEELQQVETKR